MVRNWRLLFYHNSTMNTEKIRSAFHCFIVSPCQAGFTAGIQGTHRHQSVADFVLDTRLID